MKTAKPVFDARWMGPHGIGRFASEVRSRVDGAYDDLTGADPVSPAGLALLERHGLATLRRPRLFFSPGFAAPMQWRGPVVITVHDLIHLDVPGEAGRGVRTYYERVVRPAVRRAPVVFTMSEHARGRLAEWSGVAPERIAVAGNAAGSTFAPHGPRHQPGYPYVLYVGNHKPHKNLPRLLRAFADPRLADVHLLLTGDADPEVEVLARHEGVAERVHAAGFVSEVDLPGYYRGALALAMPSLYEGFGLPVIEAMACATPVVAADATSIPEVAGEAALLVDPLDVDALAHALVTGVHDDVVRARLVAAGPRQAARFDWDAVGRMVNERLRDATGGL